MQNNNSGANASNDWYLEVADLIGSPGETREVEKTIPAPAGLGNPMIGVPENSPMDVTVRLDSVHEGILVSGQIVADIEGECARCLDPISDEASISVNELFLFEAEPEAEESDEEQPLVSGDMVDIEPMMRTGMVSSIPFQPRCKPDCQGLCDQCGIRLEDAEEGHHHEQIDPRWAALATLASSNDDNDNDHNDTEER